MLSFDGGVCPLSFSCDGVKRVHALARDGLKNAGPRGAERAVSPLDDCVLAAAAHLIVRRQCAGKQR